MNTQQTVKPFWLSAAQVMKSTGMTKDDLKRLRRDNPSVYKIENGSKGYRYNITAIPDTLIKKTA